MNNKYFRQLKEVFVKHPDLKDDYNDLYELITVINKSIDMQDEVNEINKRITELNEIKDKEEK